MRIYEKLNFSQKKIHKNIIKAKIRKKNVERKIYFNLYLMNQIDLQQRKIKQSLYIKSNFC